MEVPICECGRPITKRGAFCNACYSRRYYAKHRDELLAKERERRKVHGERLRLEAKLRRLRARERVFRWPKRKSQSAERIIVRKLKRLALARRYKWKPTI